MIRRVGGLALAICLSCAAPTVPNEVRGSIVEEAIRQSYTFKHRPSSNSIIQDGWLGFVPHADPLSGTCELDLVELGYLTRDSGGAIEPTSCLSPAQFRRRSKTVYLIRCAHPLFLKVDHVQRNAHSLVAKFQWKYVPEGACTEIRVPAIRGVLDATHTSYAGITEVNGTMHVLGISDFGGSYYQTNGRIDPD